MNRGSAVAPLIDTAVGTAVDVDKHGKLAAKISTGESPPAKLRWRSLAEKNSKKQNRTPTITSNASGYATTKAIAVVSAGEIGRIVDLGLGRGVDITKPSPWLNKSSFQVRPVDQENIIGTEEGGSLQNYEREIISIQEQQGELKAAITIPQSPVSIGVDAEQARSHTTTRRSVGKKVVNRTISFRADFHDAPKSCTGDPRQAKAEASLALSERKFSSGPTLALGHSTSILQQKSFSGGTITRSCVLDEANMTFEERLCKWILERVIHRSELRAMHALIDKSTQSPEVVPDLSSPIESLGKYIQLCSHEERKEVVGDCKNFVYHFRITHYVSAIELGAAEYRVMSEEEYETRVGMGGSFGVEAIANAAVKEKASWKKTKRASDLKRIGLIKQDGTVERGSYGEAVVGIQVQPISSLVKIRYLGLALQQALLEYSTEEGNKNSGPFIISCNNDGVYLTVNKDENDSLEGTININKASTFHIVPSDGSHPNEFMIIYCSEDTSSRRDQLRRGSTSLNVHLQQAVRSMPKYLNADTSVRGKNPGPIYMEMKVEESCAKLVLQSRVLTKKHQMVMDITSWVNGRDVYFIRCARRRFKKEGYLCMKFKPGQDRAPPYRIKIVPSTDAHNEDNKFMLFRLLPVSVKQQMMPQIERNDSSDDTQTGSSDDTSSRLELEKLSVQYRRFSEWRTASRRDK